MDGKSREALKEAAGECVSEHLRLEYKKLPNSWVNTDVYPDLYENFRGEMCKRLREMYSDSIYLIFPGQGLSTAAFSINKMQREHVVPKSWWKDYSKTDPTNKEYNIEYTPAYSDLSESPPLRREGQQCQIQLAAWGDDGKSEVQQ